MKGSACSSVFAVSARLGTVIAGILISGSIRSGTGTDTGGAHAPPGGPAAGGPAGTQRWPRLGNRGPLCGPASSMPPCPQRGDPVLFPFRCILFFEKRKKRKLFWALSSVRENLLGLGASHFLSPRLSTSSAGPAPSRPAHRLHAGGTWACPLDRPRGALRGPNPVLVPTCRAVAGGGGSP